MTKYLHEMLTRLGSTFHAEHHNDRLYSARWRACFAEPCATLSEAVEELDDGIDEAELDQLYAT